MNLTDMMKQVQKVQAQMTKIQEEMAGKTVQAEAGGGMVTAVANGRQEIVSITIAPECISLNDVSMLQDLVTAAVNEALASSKKMFQEEVSKITGGIRIPGITL